MLCKNFQISIHLNYFNPVEDHIDYETCGTQKLEFEIQIENEGCEITMF